MSLSYEEEQKRLQALWDEINIDDDAFESGSEDDSDHVFESEHNTQSDHDISTEGEM